MKQPIRVQALFYLSIQIAEKMKDSVLHVEQILQKPPIAATSVVGGVLVSTLSAAHIIN